jgi:excisionase family DNA binding protein
MRDVTRSAGLLIRTTEASRRLGIPVDEVLDLIRSKQLPGWTTDDGRVVIPADAVEHLRQQLAGNESDDLIRTYEASDRLGIPIDEVYQLIFAGEIPGWPNEDGLVVLPARAVDEYRAATAH